MGASCTAFRYETAMAMRVVVARESSRRVVVFRIENMPYDLSCLLRLSYIVVKIWYLVARFVAVPVKRSC